LKRACSKTNAEIIDYSVAPIFMEGTKKGAHEWIVEFKKHPEDIEAFKNLLDKELQNLNSDYEAKRANNITLNTIVLHVARQNLFYDWLKSKNIRFLDYLILVHI